MYGWRRKRRGKTVEVLVEVEVDSEGGGKKGDVELEDGKQEREKRGRKGAT